MRGSVSGLRAVRERYSGVPTGRAGAIRVPGETGRPAGQTPLSADLQMPAWFPQGGAVPAHLLEGSPAARSVWLDCVGCINLTHTSGLWKVVKFNDGGGSLHFKHVLSD